MPQDFEMRSTGSGIIVWDSYEANENPEDQATFTEQQVEAGGRWIPIENVLVDSGDFIAFLETLDVDGLILNNSLADIPNKPSDWIGPWPPKNKETGKDVFGDPIVTFEPNWGAIRDAVAPEPTKGMTREQADAFVAENPGSERFFKEDGTYGVRKQETPDAPKTFRTPAEAHDFAAASGLGDGDYTLTWATNGWQVNVDPVRGQRYTSFAAAERNKPPGHKTVARTLSDGSIVYTYDTADPEPRERIRSFDDLIIKRALEGASDEELMRIDRRRDLIEQPRVTPFQALQFALEAGARTPEEFQELMELVMTASEANFFARDIQAATFEFGRAQAGQAALTPEQRIAAAARISAGEEVTFGEARGDFQAGPLGGAHSGGPAVPTSDFAASLMAAAARDKALAEGADPAEAEQAANAALEQALKRAEENAELARERALDPFSDIRFGTEELEGGGTRTIERRNLPVTGEEDLEIIRRQPDGPPPIRIQTTDERGNRIGVQNADPSFVKHMQMSPEERRASRASRGSQQQSTPSSADAAEAAAQIARRQQQFADREEMEAAAKRRRPITTRFA